MKEKIVKECRSFYCQETFSGRAMYCEKHRGYSHTYRVSREDMPVVLNVKEACEALRISRSLLNKYTRSNTIKEIRIGNTRRFLKTEVLKLLE